MLQVEHEFGGELREEVRRFEVDVQDAVEAFFEGFKERAAFVEANLLCCVERSSGEVGLEFVDEEDGGRR